MQKGLQKWIFRGSCTYGNLSSFLPLCSPVYKWKWLLHCQFLLYSSPVRCKMRTRKNPAAAREWSLGSAIGAGDRGTLARPAGSCPLQHGTTPACFGMESRAVVACAQLGWTRWYWWRWLLWGPLIRPISVVSSWLWHPYRFHPSCDEAAEQIHPIMSPLRLIPICLFHVCTADFNLSVLALHQQQTWTR